MVVAIKKKARIETRPTKEGACFNLQPVNNKKRAAAHINKSRKSCVIILCRVSGFVNLFWSLSFTTAISHFLHQEGGGMRTGGGELDVRLRDASNQTLRTGIFWLIKLLDDCWRRFFVVVVIMLYRMVGFTIVPTTYELPTILIS